ncbi:MAG: transcription antitermination protein NusB [Bacteroidales bacterium]|nr:transcription antitermination protein NusB [Bacteroidales bacterium]
MINRILIRIKVVQMLYAYLLTRSEFHIESTPAKDTRDARYAYMMYLDLLLLILRLSGYKIGSKHSSGEIAGESNPLSDAPLAKALSADLDIRQLIAKGSESLDYLDAAIPDLYRHILASEAYADYRKKKGRKQLADDVRLWSILLQTTIAKDAKLMAAARQNTEFTSAGYRQAFIMAEHTLTDFVDTRVSLAAARKQLGESLDKAYELYVSMLMLPVMLTDLEAERIEAAKEKYCPTPEELNPNTRFIHNKFVEAVRNSEAVATYLKENKINSAFQGDYYLLKELLDAIRQSELYNKYMNAEVATFRDDCEFWRQALKTIVFPSDALAEAMENKSVYWNDDLAIMGTFTLKTIKQMANTEQDCSALTPEELGRLVELLPVYKNREDEAFGPTLFEGAIKNRDEYRQYIDRFINDSQWDPERLAFTDIVILITAITELIAFPSIPVPVTLNEYIEIANYYSTARSGQFINGVLFSIVNYLKEQGKLLK